MFAESSSVTALSLSAAILTATVIFALVPVIFLCIRYYRRSEEPPDDEEVDLEKSKIVELVKKYLEKDNTFKFVKPLRNLGSRLHKYWMEVCKSGGNGKEEASYILTASPLSKNFSFELNDTNVYRLNELFQELNKHPYIHKIEKIDHIGGGNVAIIQELVPEGSLRDLIYNQAGYDVSWSEKIYDAGSGLPIDRILLYGRHILDAMIFLKEAGFPHLGHVHSGNIFIVGEDCRIGGHDNTVLGYRTSLYKEIKESDMLKSMDTIIFGRLIFEMHTCRVPEELIPTEASIDGCEEIIKKFLKHIFEVKRKSGTELKHLNLKKFYKDTFLNPNHKWYNRSPPRKVIDYRIGQEIKQMLVNVKR